MAGQARRTGGICRRWPIPLWIPNIIAYMRIAAYGKAFTVAFTNKRLFTALYMLWQDWSPLNFAASNFMYFSDGSLSGPCMMKVMYNPLWERVTSFFIHELNGPFAKAINQSSTFGDVMSHISSRISNTGLLLVLSHLYKRDYRLLLGLLALDIASHWLRIYCEIVCRKMGCQMLGETKTGIFQLLWQNSVFRSYCSLSQEALYITLYLMSYEMVEQRRPVTLYWEKMKYSDFYNPLCASIPGFILKQLVNLGEIKHATHMCIVFDHEKKLTNRTPRTSRARRRSMSRSTSRSRRRSRSRSWSRNVSDD